MTRIRFSPGSGLAGALVRWGTWSPYSHIGIELAPNTVLDSIPGVGVSIRSITDEGGSVYLRIACPADVVSRAVAAGQARIGQPYDWSACYGFAVRRDWHQEGAWDCSEAVHQCFVDAGWPLIRAQHLNRVTPSDLLLSPYLIPEEIALVPSRAAA
jgi:uncharacterized protein YycO